MRVRLSTIAAFIVLGFAILIISIHAFVNVNEVNELTTQSLKTACRLSAVALDSAASSDFGDIDDVISSYAEMDRYDICLFESDGRLAYSNSKETLPLTQQELSLAASQEVSVYSDAYNNTVDLYLYGIVTLESGEILRLSVPEYSVGNWLLDHSMIYAAVTLGCMLAMYLCVYQMLNKQHRMISRIIGVLEDFTEGHYSSRIEGVEGDSVFQTEQFNAVVSRLEEQVFKVGTRNRAFNNVMNQMKSGILVVDSNMKVVLLSSVAKQLLGIKGNAEGQHIANASKDVPLENAFSEASTSHGVYTCEVAARSETGRAHKPLRLYISTMTQDNKVVGMLALVDDISELRKLEQMRTDFAANVSHELKTPLTSIRGFVETLMEGAIDNPKYARKFLTIIMSETNRLTRLINDILSISKLESGGDPVQTERLQLDELTDSICEMLSMQASDKQVELNYRRNSKPVYIIGNRDRTEQVLINLIENAIKYNKQGGSVTVKIYTNDQNTECYFSVADTGIGIPEEHMGRLFERFYRVDKGRSRSMGGTGLGLAIVKHIVRSMNGTIEVQSKFGEGTEFLVTLPLAAEGDKGTMGEKLDTDEFKEI